MIRINPYDDRYWIIWIDLSSGFYSESANSRTNSPQNWLSLVRPSQLIMNCLIDAVVEEYQKQGKSLEAVREYIRSQYRINIELNALRKRLELLDVENPI